jgi:hypothetical protein
METNNQNTDVLKQIKTSFESSALKTNLTTALEEIKTICSQREYVVEGSIDKIISDINFENSTLTSRKKLAKKIYFFIKKKSRKTISALLSFVRKSFLGEEYRVSVKPSLLEQEIISLREKYKKLFKETEETRVQLKVKKKEFYGKNK